MERVTLGDGRQVGFDGLYAEAKQTLSVAGNRLRSTTQLFREAYAEALESWQRVRADLAAVASPNAADPSGPPAAEMIRRSELQSESDGMSVGLARAKSSLARLGLATEDLERTWLFLERGRVGAIPDEAAHPDADPVVARSLRMHVLEAQESERTRLAEDLHDGPAQAFANALFQIEVIDRGLHRDATDTEAEVQALRALLERALDAVRGYISQLRPTLRGRRPRRGVARVDRRAGSRRRDRRCEPGGTGHSAGRPPSHRRPARRPGSAPQRSEACRRKPGPPRDQTAEGWDGHFAWVLEVRDDGRGFDFEETVGRGGRRHFGLRFMRSARTSSEPASRSSPIHRQGPSSG